MSSGANVKRVQALRELNTSICSFSQTLDAHLRTVRAEVNKAIEWIAERERHWRGEVRRCATALRSAKQAYQSCQARPRDESRYSSCSTEASAVRNAEKELAQAKKELQNVLVWKQRVKNKAHDFMGQSVRVRKLTNETFSQASSFLRGKVADLAPYSSSGMQSPTQISSFSTHGSDYRKAKQEMLMRALDDPLVGRHIKGWIRNELRRVENLRRARAEGRPVEHPYSVNIRMPPGLDAGHAVWGLDTAGNLRFEGIYENRSRYHRARRLGIEDRIR